MAQLSLSDVGRRWLALHPGNRIAVFREGDRLEPITVAPRVLNSDWGRKLVCRGRGPLIAILRGKH